MVVCTYGKPRASLARVPTRQRMNFRMVLSVAGGSHRLLLLHTENNWRWLAGLLCERNLPAACLDVRFAISCIRMCTESLRKEYQICISLRYAFGKYIYYVQYVSLMVLRAFYAYIIE